MRILSGIQPSGALHLGNYFGMMRPAIELQEKGEAFYFIANYHSMTSLFDAAERRKNTLDVALDFLACGLDPKRSVFWRQSDVPEVCELTWMLGTLTPMGLLERCHSFKDKSAKGIPVNHGLFAYPVLMAADILLFDSNIVPVGRDQKQHVEVTRDIAIKFNEAYGHTFVIPEPQIKDETAAVPGLDGQKMSKSYGNTIDLQMEGKELKKTVMAVKTDSTPVEAPKNPETCNVYALYSLFATEDEQKALAGKYRAGGMGYGDAKKALLEKIEAYFAPYRAKRADLAKNMDHVEKVLLDGAARASAVAHVTLDEAKRACGLK